MNSQIEERRTLATLAILSLLGCGIALGSGVLSALTYTTLEPQIREWNLTLRQLRPIHESFAFAWVFLGGVTVVHAWMFMEKGAWSRAERIRCTLQNTLWTVSGVGIVISLLRGQFSGREYAGYSSVYSALILAGWILFAWNYFGRAGFRLRGKPVYQYMWWTGILLYIFTSVESHVYLLESVSRNPLRDLAIQWKSNGVMVGSFNQIVYGALMWVLCRMRGDESYAHSRTAYALFVIGVLNTFTNYGHHTFHLPQSAWVHGISFGVSMIEIAILAKVLVDLLRLRRAAPPRPEFTIPARFAISTTGWTFVMLTLSIAISIPSLNSMIHGTHGVVAHAMGSMIGIDSMILWTAFSWMLCEFAGARGGPASARWIRSTVLAIDLLLALWIATFLFNGILSGMNRYLGPDSPDSSRFALWFPSLMASLGSALAFVVFALVARWLWAFGQMWRKDV